MGLRQRQSKIVAPRWASVRRAIVGVAAAVFMLAALSAPAARPARANDEPLTGRGPVRVSHDSGTGVQAEYSLAANPLNPDNLVLASMVHCDPSKNIFLDTRAAVFISTDDGASWRGGCSSLVPSIPATQLSGDPSIAFDSRGTLHYGALDVAWDSTAGVDQCAGRLQVVASRSTAQGDVTGLNLSAPVLIASSAAGDGANLYVDKPMLTADRSTVSPFRDHVYVAWEQLAYPSLSDCEKGQNAGGGIAFASSTDEGASFSAPSYPSPMTGPAEAPSLAVASNGDLYAAWTGFSDGFFIASATCRHMVTRSTDGGATFGTVVDVDTVQPLPDEVPGFAFRPDDNSDPILSIGQGPLNGVIFLVWSDYDVDGLPLGATITPARRCPRSDSEAYDTACQANILLTRSLDQGQTWTPPVKVSDTPPGAESVFPHVDTSPEGLVTIGYYDSRRSTANAHVLDAFVTQSGDGVVFNSSTWASARPIDPSLDLSSRFFPTGPPGAFIGDYSALIARDSSIQIVWPGNSPETGALIPFTATLLSPLPAPSPSTEP
jgi:hypothetical protein